VIFLARIGSTKEEIADYVSGEFGYDYSETLEEMRARHKMDESCMDALPKALRSFMDGKSLEDTIRNAVSLGGDTDTIAAIAGAMAEGMYGIPVLYKGKVLLFVEDDMRAVLGEFEKAVGRLKEEDITLTEGDEEEDGSKDHGYPEGGTGQR
jgi:type I restriction enzyme M protein